MKFYISTSEVATTTLSMSMEEALKGLMLTIFAQNSASTNLTNVLELVACVIVMEKELVPMMDEIKSLNIQNMSLAKQLSVLR